MHAVLVAHLPYAFVAETQGDAEAAHHQQHGIVVAHQITHAIVSIIGTQFIHSILFFRS